MIKILIALIDKEKAIKINNFLEDSGFSPYIITDTSVFISKVVDKKFKILILDVCIIESLELDVMKFIKEKNPFLKVILISNEEKIDKALKLARENNFLYLTEPFKLNELKFSIDTLIKEIEKEEDLILKEDEFFKTKFIGKSEKIKKVIELAKKVAKSDSNILITGETGTGKELMARSIYEMSARANGPFVAVNCAAIPENLLESELFGYKKGAFTGANSDKKGLVEIADKGVLFLDEIGDLPLSLQAKLLRVIEYKEVRRLGDESLRKVDIRVIAATNQNLVELIKEKKFREDLFFRINVVHIPIPPLRERKEDISILIRFFVEKYNKIYNKNILGIDSRAKSILLKYDYPGNVRELENIIHHAFSVTENDIISIDDLPLYLQKIQPYYSLNPAYDIEKKDEEEILSLKELEKRAILKALQKYKNNQTKVAEVLGISRSTLWRKLKEHNISI